MTLAPYLVLLLLAACTAAALAVRATAYATPVARSFALAMLGLVVWTTTSGLCLLPADLSTRAWLYALEWVGFVLVPSAWLLFALQFATGGGTGRAVLLGLPGLGFLALAWTNPVHGWMWHTLAVDATPLPTLNVGRAAGYWAYTAYAYAQVAGAVFLLVRSVWRLGHRYRQQGLSLLVGTSVPLVTNLAYNLQIGPIPNLDLTPVAFTVTGVMLGWGLLRLRLLDLVPVAAPVAHRAIVEGMADGVLVLDREGVVLDANPAVEGMLSRRRADLVGRRLEAVLHAQPGQAEASTEAVVDGPSERRYYDVRRSCLRQPNSEQAGQLVVLRDITGRKRAGEALRASEERYRSVVDSVREVIFQTDATGAWTFLNRAWAEITGFPVQSSIGRPAHELVHSDDQPCSWPACARWSSGAPTTGAASCATWPATAACGGWR